jgi:hypothetical protein
VRGGSQTIAKSLNLWHLSAIFPPYKDFIYGENQMKRLLVLITATLVSLPTMAAEPSAMFGQELAQVSKPNAINIDFMNSATPTIRVGTNKGEVIATYAGSLYGPGSNYLAYKWFVGNSFAIYAGLGMNGGTNDVLLIGGAYTIDSNNIRFNINPVINLVDPAGTQTDIYAGAYMKLKGGNTNGRMMVGAQFHMDVTANTSGVIGGIRWQPRNNLTIDLALVNTDAGAGGLDFPGVFTINMSF